MSINITFLVKLSKNKVVPTVQYNACNISVISYIFVLLQDILKQAMEDNLRSAADLPYFEGDFWPNVLEESIKELDQEEEEKRKQAEAAEAAAAAANAVRTYLKCRRNGKLKYVSNFLCRYIPCRKRVRWGLMVRKRARRRRRKAINRRRTKGKIVKSPILHRLETICRQRFLRRWRSTRKFFSL